MCTFPTIRIKWLKELEFRFYVNTGHVWIRHYLWKGYKDPHAWAKFETSPERATKLRAWLALRFWGYRIGRDTYYAISSSDYVQLRLNPY